MIAFGPAALATAFAAGFLSFTSPCVLPLVPGYLSYVSGVGVDGLGAPPRRVTVTTAWFVAGFAAMFIALGAAAAWFGTALIEHRRALEIAGGISVVFAGLVFAGVRLPTTLLREQVSLAANRRSHCAVAGGRRLRRRLDAVRRPDARRDPRALGRRRQP